MATWPTDERTKTKTTNENGTEIGGKRRNYPYLEAGLIGAATLSKESLDWTFFSNPRTEDDFLAQHLRFGKHIQIFPPTRASPMRPDKMSIKQLAEQGANFLRTYLPDVDVTSELIREHLTEDIAMSRMLERFDPHLGNLLDVFRPETTPSQPYLLFPTGEANCSLNACCIEFADTRNIVFHRRSPLYSSQTPIRQLSLSHHLQVLAVRSFGPLKILKLMPDDHFKGLRCSELAAFSLSDFGNEMVVDMKFPSLSPKLFTIGHKGSLFECDLVSGAEGITHLFQAESLTASEQNNAEFWRLSLSNNSHNFLIMSSKEVVHFDSRSRSTQKTFSMARGKHVLTAIEDVKQENLVPMCSTKDILWLDLRNPGKLVLAYAHDREFDQSLSTTTVAYPGQNPLTFLSCRNNGLVTVYDVSQSNQGLIQLNQPPYMLASSKSLYEKYTGQQFLVEDAGLCLLRLSERGGVCCSEIHPANSEVERQLIVEKVAELGSSAKDLPDRSTLGDQNYTEVDMHEKYNMLFNEYFRDRKELEGRAEQSAEQMIQLFPYYMRNSELPIEHILTTYDIAFRAGAEPTRSGRADFLTESILNSSKAFEALKEGHLAPHLIKVPWHRSIASTIGRLDKDFRSDPQELMEYLQEFNLVGEHISKNVRELEQAACQQLSLDLIMSSDIVSKTRFSQCEVEHSLETMTEALSLRGDPPPAVKFGYLRPLVKGRSSCDIGERSDVLQPEIPPGVRCLLKEWDNNNPDEYVYRDPYAAEEPPPPLKFAKEATIPQFVAQNKGPPKILTSSAILPAISEETGQMTVLRAQSQKVTALVPYDKELEGPPGSTQNLVVSTQVVPGRFGGRPTMKKFAKKRLGGF